MKATVGLLLLLLTVYYCAAAPQQLLEMSHGQCCFKFFTRRIPQKKIVSVIKTHSACLEKAFVIGTATGRRICVSQSVTWAQEAFASMANLQNDDE
ncbi:C-C motif chemokine 3-like [Pundamilia nyererei]|uniref:C-C motif chemokine 3-like n=1 Tax=Pundamilia nyererei TaxID=303518 RepID=A0A9Y3RB85_9CICH|nr:PREDICTED: C-C motif chemokine 3-like [Pundamilia nyererei]